MARDVACGLRYLHEEKRLLHGDLKSANILIQGDFKTAKICDFGVSLKLDEKVVNALFFFFLVSLLFYALCQTIYCIHIY